MSFTPSPGPNRNSAERYQPLVLLLAALALGMVIDRYAPLAAEEWAAISLTLLLFWSVAWIAGRLLPASALLLGSLLALGGAWHHDQWRLYAPDEIGRFAKEETQPVVVEAVALTSPRFVPAPPLTALRSIPKGDHTELLVRLRSVRNGCDWQAASGTAALDVEGHLLGIRAGDRLRIGALATKPPAPLNPGEFDFAGHQRSRRILCRLRGLFPENIALVEQGSFWNWRQWLAMVRDAGNLQFRRHVGGSRTGLAAAILLGARELIDPEKNEGFLVTGTVHVLSISGVHVGILAWGFWVVARTGFLPRTAALVAVMLFVSFYALLTDAQPPVVRAAVLIVVLCLARLWGRRTLGFNSLAAAGLVVLAFDPLSLFHVGTQLSFLAVAGMILFRRWLAPEPLHDPLDRLIGQTRPWYVRWTKAVAMETWRICLTGAVIWAIALPLVWKQYNRYCPDETTHRLLPLPALRWALSLPAWILPILPNCAPWHANTATS